MGTSKNYPSPNSPRWNAVRTGYRNKAISERRIATEVWRAATSENSDLTSMLSSEIIFRCNTIVKNSANAIEAYKTFSQEIVASKQSSIATEFAKRAIVQSYGGGDPVENWRSNFVSEVTDYFVSRDVAGYFGAGSRNSNIDEMVSFRSSIRNIVVEKVSAVKTDIKSSNDWRDYIDSTVNRLKSSD